MVVLPHAPGGFRLLFAGGPKNQVRTSCAARLSHDLRESRQRIALTTYTVNRILSHVEEAPG